MALLIVICFSDLSWLLAFLQKYSGFGLSTVLTKFSVISRALEGEGESSNHYRGFIPAKGIIRWL